MQKKLLLKRGSSIIVNAIKKDKSTRLKKLILLLVVFFINQYGNCDFIYYIFLFLLRIIIFQYNLYVKNLS